MHTSRTKLLLLMTLLLVPWTVTAEQAVPKAPEAAPAAEAEKTYNQAIDVVYATIDGEDFYMDIFTPSGKGKPPYDAPSDTGKGLGIIDIASGAWYSDRGKIRDHDMAQFYTIFCHRGYTVFAVRPGTRPKYDALEMVDHIKRAIRWVKAHAAEYGIDPERLGLTGASAGGHLASLVTMLAEDGDANAADPMGKLDTRVKAVSVFFPPTDFLDWNGIPSEQVYARVGEIFFRGGIKEKTPEEIEARAREISPRLQIKGKTPPFLIYHGDKDPLVPLQQSEIFVESLKAAGNDAELRVKEGGAHPWFTIPEEVNMVANWFDERLPG